MLPFPLGGDLNLVFFETLGALQGFVGDTFNIKDIKHIILGSRIDAEVKAVRALDAGHSRPKFCGFHVCLSRLVCEPFQILTTT